MADKEAILASLNIKAMTFDDTIGVLTQSKCKVLSYPVTCDNVTHVTEITTARLKVSDFLRK